MVAEVESARCNCVLLICSQITLEDMIDRFRPNVVVSGSEPYAEEQWKEIAVGNVTLKVYIYT